MDYLVIFLFFLIFKYKISYLLIVFDMDFSVSLDR
jgi:hypothetical protein